MNNNKPSKRSKFLSERNEKSKTDNNMLCAIKELVNAKQKKKDNSSKIPKISPGERKNYLILSNEYLLLNFSNNHSKNKLTKHT